MEQITIDFEGSEDGLQWQANAMGYQESPTPSIAWEFGLELGSYTVTLEKISPEDTVMSFWYVCQLLGSRRRLSDRLI